MFNNKMFCDYKLSELIEETITFWDRTLAWYKSDDKDYITNGYWLISLNLRNYPMTLGKVVACLGDIPKNWEEISVNRECIEIQDGGKIIDEAFTCIKKQKISVIKTPAIIDFGNGKCRLYKSAKDEVISIDEMLSSVVDVYEFNNYELEEEGSITTTVAQAKGSNGILIENQIISEYIFMMPVSLNKHIRGDIKELLSIELKGLEG